MMTKFAAFFETRPLAARLVWLLFAVVFYVSGEAFTLWLLEPERIGGGAQWLRVALFPFLVPAFFVVNRYLGCATGGCARGQCAVGGKQFPGH